MRLITRGGYNWADCYPWIVEAARKNRVKQFTIRCEAADFWLMLAALRAVPQKANSRARKTLS